MAIDAHAHLDDPKFNEDREAVIARAADAGIAAIITCGTDLPSSRHSLELAEKHPNIYAAVGFHPHDAKKFRPADLTTLREWLQHPKVVAVGEIGLDFHYNFSPPDVQERVLRAQLELAAETGKPVVVHNREARAKTWELLAAWAAQAPPLAHGLRGQLHCFSEDLAFAKQVRGLGMLVSLAGPVTFPKSTELVEVARGMALDDLLVETDAPYLSPHPHRGKRNEPSRVLVTAEFVAQVRGEPAETVIAATAANARRLFGLP